MKISRCIGVMLVATLMPIYGMAATIPKTFHGEWVASDEPPKNCENIDHKVFIDAKNYGEYELGCDVKKVTPKKNKAVFVNLLCSSEGDSFKNSRTLQLKDAKHLNISSDNGTQTYARCPRSSQK